MFTKRKLSTWNRAVAQIVAAGYGICNYRKIGGIGTASVFVNELTFTLRAGKLSATALHSAPPADIYATVLQTAIAELNQKKVGESWRLSKFRNSEGKNDYYLELILFVDVEESAVLAIHLTDSMFDLAALENVTVEMAELLQNFKF